MTLFESAAIASCIATFETADRELHRARRALRPALLRNAHDHVNVAHVAAALHAIGYSTGDAFDEGVSW